MRNPKHLCAFQWFRATMTVREHCTVFQTFSDQMLMSLFVQTLGYPLAFYHGLISWIGGKEQIDLVPTAVSFLELAVALVLDRMFCSRFAMHRLQNGNSENQVIFWNGQLWAILFSDRTEVPSFCCTALVFPKSGCDRDQPYTLGHYISFERPQHAPSLSCFDFCGIIPSSFHQS